MKRFLLLGASMVMLAGCVLPPAQSNQVLTVLNQVANTATADINQQIAVANAATPPDTDGARCGQSALVVGAAMQKVLAATPAGSTIGVFTVAEVASLYQPGSAQYNYAVTTLETGCIAKVHDINQSLQSQASVIAAIPSILALAPAVGL